MQHINQLKLDKKMCENMATSESQERVEDAESNLDSVDQPNFATIECNNHLTRPLPCSLTQSYSLRAFMTLLCTFFLLTTTTQPSYTHNTNDNDLLLQSLASDHTGPFFGGQPSIKQLNESLHGGDGRVISDAVLERYANDDVLRSIAVKRPDELPALTSSFNADDEKQLQASDNFFFKTDTLHKRYSIVDLGLMGLVAKAQAMVYGDIYFHRYDSYQDMKQSSGPHVDNELCIRQLDELADRAERQMREKYRSKDLNFYQLMDAWGHLDSGLTVGNGFFEGMYHECLRLKIRTNSDELVPTRYCVASLKHIDWPKIDKYDILGIKAGICLPRSCDSVNYKNKFDSLRRIAEYHLRPVEQGEIQLTNIYCLPDEDSPARSVWHSPRATLVLMAFCVWFTMLAYATYKHHKLAHFFNTESECERLGAKGFGLTNMNITRRSERTSSMNNQEQQNIEDQVHCVKRRALRSSYKVYAMLSVTNNLKLLFDTTKESSLMEAGSKISNSKHKNSDTDLAPGGDTKSPLVEQTKQKFIDLRCIEGVKVVAMTYVIMGHVLMCITSIMSNGREMAGNGSIAFYIANLVPAFAVNSFFTITGILTCYLMFKQNQSYPFITSPSKWIAFIVYRYLRIMPMYALVVLYCKSLAKYTGSGPFWDYATSSLAQRRTCEQESWSWTLMFKSNFMPPLQHCIPGGWYLSNDFQFFLVTPFIMALLYKQPMLGKALLYTGIIAGYMGGFYSIMSAPVADLKPIASFAPHGFKTYISHFSFNYTHPQYRIPAYLIGLLVGYKLFLYERNKQEYHENKKRLQANKSLDSSQEVQKNITLSSHTHNDKEPDWSDGFKRHAMMWCLLLVTGCCLTPVIGSMIPFTKTSARIMVALITPSYHVMFSTAVGMYLLLATTGYGYKRLNDLLASPLWKPLARLSLCAVLINVEVINYIIQSNSNVHYINNQYQLALNCICVIATYVASVVVCVLFEAPIRAGLNGVLTYAVTRVAAANKRKTS